MRKLFLLVAACIGAVAQAQIEEGKVYTIRNAKSQGAYMQDNFSDDDVVDAFGMNEYSYWTFIATGNADCYYIRNMATGRYIQGHSEQSEVKTKAGDAPAEYHVKAFSNEGGAYGFSSTAIPVHDFTSGCMGLNLRGEPHETVSCVQSYAAVAGTNHRSFWLLEEIDPESINLPEIIPGEDLSGVDESELYHNPIVETSLPDPTIIKAEDGYFYLYATENIRNMPIYRSSNLVDWDFVGTCFTEETRPTFVNTTRQSCLWAPDINFIDNHYVMYYSMSDWGKEWECGIGVAVADKPEGPFTDLGKLFISSEMGTQNSIDPFFIEEDGHKYLFWGSFRGIWYTELTDDGLALKNGMTFTKVADTMTEGTYIEKRPDGYYYMIGSAGTCCDGLNSTYRLMVARSESLFGPYVNKAGKTVMENCWSKLLGKSDEVYGPGHCSEIVQDEAGQSWIFYHGWDAASGNGRYLYMDQIHWGSDGWPQIVGSKPSTVARKPVFSNTGTGVETVSAKKATISPKRVKESFSINVPDNADFSWQVSSTHGETVAAGKGKGQVTVKTGCIPWGLYIVTVNRNGKKYSEKILKV
ncbi:MAG: family 43 glycosylhydrolase [Prevotella sp.]